MLARRCTLDAGRSPTYGFAELARLTGVSEKRARASVNHLVAAGLLSWSDAVIDFPDGGSRSGPDPDDDPLADSIGGGKGSLAIPRRILRLLAGGARPALIATALAILLRCLSRGRGGFRSRGRVKASWIARTFDVDLRRVKQARKDLIDRGWIVPELTDQWAENSWGRTYHIDLAWDRVAVLLDGRRLPPPPVAGGRRLPPPDLDPELLREVKNQEPAPGGPAGVEIQQGGEKTILPPALATRATVAPPIPADREQESGSRRSTPVANGAGISPSRVEPGRTVTPRPAVMIGGAGGAPLPAPTLNDVRVEDLKDTGRLLQLHDQAVARDLIGSSESDRLRFVGAAEHAMAVGRRNPSGLFCHLIRGRLWRYLTQEDEDRANARIKRELRGEPSPRPGIGAGARWGGPVLSADARLVREVRSALIRAGIFRDPFPAFRARNPGWTRERWEAAWAESAESRGAT